MLFASDVEVIASLKRSSEMIVAVHEKSEAEILEALRGLGCQTVEAFHQDALDAYACTQADRQWFLFQGSRNVRDWLTNLNYGFVRVPGFGRVHRGFYESFERNWQDVASFIARNDSGLPIEIGGHSNGAATATLFTKSLFGLTRGRIEKLTTLGAPCVGNDEFAASFPAIPVVRVVYAADAVPRLNEKLPAQQAAHIGTLFFFDPILGLRIAPSGGFVIARTVLRLAMAGPLAAFGDHSPELYARAAQDATLGNFKGIIEDRPSTAR